MINKNIHKTPLSVLGEFGLIDHLTSGLVNRQLSTLKGVGDDAALINPGKRLVAVSTDLLLEGIHFNLSYNPLRHLGYKAVVVNVSDICAMNLQPAQITVSIGVSSRFFQEDLEALYEGIRLACEKYNVDLVGGDTSASRTGLVISITVVGLGEKEKIVYRNTAKENDLICITGNLGAAYLGLQLLIRENKIFQEDPSLQPRLEGYDYLLQRQLKPEARNDIISLFHERGVSPNAMIDVSDGLSSDLLHLCRQSGLGCRIRATDIPLHTMTRKVAGEFNMEPETAALNGGEDYELLFTIPEMEYHKISDAEDITVIGKITGKGEKSLLEVSGKEYELVAQGFNQLR